MMLGEEWEMGNSLENSPVKWLWPGAAEEAERGEERIGGRGLEVKSECREYFSTFRDLLLTLQPRAL